MSNHSTPSRAGFAALALGIIILAGCGVPGKVAAGHALAPAAPTATAAALPPIRLPQDEAPHTDLTEWWYYTGHLQGTDPSGQTHTYGFELTFFQISRGNLGPDYVGHYAVTDLTRGAYASDQRLVALATPLASTPTTAGFDLHIGDWAMRGVNGQDQLAASMPNYAIQLNLTGTKPPALHGGNGLITYGVFGFSYYYSRTSMTVSGQIQDHGVTIPLTGLAWMDHQWGNFIPTAGGGWDWFSVQLANNVQYMIYLIRDTTGKVSSVVGTRVDAQGQTSEIPASAIQETVNDHWTSPATHIQYPSGWTLALPDGHLTITPLQRDQEFVAASTTGNTYWEGACGVSGQLGGQAVTGEGYTELTGYHA